MRIFKISVLIAKSDIVWDYKKQFGHELWPDIEKKLTDSVASTSLLTDVKSSFQHIYYFTSDADESVCRTEAENAVFNLLGIDRADRKVIVFVGVPDQDELSRLRRKMPESLSSNSDFWASADALFSDNKASAPAPAPREPEPAPADEPVQTISLNMPASTAAAPAEPEKNDEPLTLSGSLCSLKKMKDELLRVIHGQRHAIDETVQTVFESKMFSSFDEKRKGPLATMLFAGPSGVGKTFLASQIKDHLGCEMLVVDMSEYSDNLANGKFNGEHGNPAVVTGFVRNNPNGIIVFDEIEKAHINTIHLFLQILDAGRLMDHHIKKEVSFRDTIIIMTTNAGKSLYEDSTVCDLSQTPRNVILEALRTDVNPATREPYFPECITTRMANGHVILFNHLEPFSLMAIVKDEIEKQIALFKKSTGLTVDYDPRALAALMLYSGGGVSDARTLRGLARNTVVKELQEVLLQFSAKYGERVNSLESITVSVDKDGDEGVSELFANNKQMRVAVFAEEGIKAFDGGSFNGSSTVFEVIRDPDLFKRRVRGVIDYILVDPLCGLTVSDKMPNDIEDLNSDGMRIFNYAREYTPEIPVYILDLSGREAGDFDTLLAKGARGIIKLDPSATEEFEEALDELSLNARINNGVFSLGRTGKVLSFNCAQYIIDDTAVAISFEKLCLKSAPAAGDAANIARKGENNNLMFVDVIGCKTAKAALSEYCKALDDPRETALKGQKMPKGVLLYGPPGTGKTMLAKAMANECGATFFPVSATSFFGSYVGETERNIRELFKKARRYAPSIIFVDEVDAIGRRRSGSASTAHNEDALNTFLAEMDGFVNDEKRPVFILAATNYELDGDSGRVLDSAFVRRFDKKLNIPLPDTDDRYELILMSLRKHGIHFGENHEKIAKNMAERTGGMSNADLEMMNASYARAAADGEPSGSAYMDALDEFRFGDVNKMDPDHLRQTACHEAGHALVCRLCSNTPSFLTIVSRGYFGGYMESSSEKASGTYTYSELMDLVCRCLAGRAAEIELYGEGAGINTGASSDIQKARYYIKACLGDYAMGENLFARWKPEEAEALMKQQFERTKEMLSRHRSTLEALTDLLCQKKSLDKNEMEAFFQKEGI
ncbi:MAG: AAA family ATPase [Clostridia bacterium]|nr:AAA family ATPase [Clostridia bacterium]